MVLRFAQRQFLESLRTLSTHIKLLQEAHIGCEHLHDGSEVVLINARRHVDQGRVEVELDAHLDELPWVKLRDVQVYDQLLQRTQFPLLLEVVHHLFERVLGDVLDLVAEDERFEALEEKFVSLVFLEGGPEGGEEEPE